jgi:chromosomal replication initiation ATPase DnaA
MNASYYVYPGLKYSLMSKRQRMNLKFGKQEGIQLKILKAICDYYRFTEADIKQKCRKRQFVWCRQVYYYLCLRLTSMTLIEIGKEFGQDHTTVIHGNETIKDIMASDPDKRREVNEIECLLD